MPDIFTLIDSHALIYRAYYAIPPLTTNQGTLVNAAFGYTRILLSTIKQLKPEYIVATFDHPKPTFRHTEYVDYKAHREEMPSDLQPQIPIVKKIVKTLNIPTFEVEGYEADDIIGTLTRQIEKKYPKLLSIIITGDKDAFQLVTDKTHVYIPDYRKKISIEYDAEKVKQKMKVTPEQIIDFKALCGDPSDNIPGIKGIGPKTAAKLLNEFETLENIYETIQSMSKNTKKENSTLKGSVLTKLAEGHQEALLSQKLATIDRDVPIQFKLPACSLHDYDKEEATALLEELEFHSLIKDLPVDTFERKIEDALF